MALRLTIVSVHGPKLGARSVKEFGPDGGTIGRSLECNWVLPDTKRYLSSRHASIDFRSGSYYIVDTSMNGVYVNDAEQPVGRGTPQRLFDGDRLRIGEYEISVEIDEDPLTPLIDENHIDPVDLAQRVEAPEPTGNDMVDAYEITGVGIEMMLTDDELETLSPPPRSKGAYFEIVDDDDPGRLPSIELETGASDTVRAMKAPPRASGAAAGRSPAAPTSTAAGRPATGQPAAGTRPAAARKAAPATHRAAAKPAAAAAPGAAAAAGAAGAAPAATVAKRAAAAKPTTAAPAPSAPNPAPANAAAAVKSGAAAKPSAAAATKPAAAAAAPKPPAGVAGAAAKSSAEPAAVPGPASTSAAAPSPSAPAARTAASQTATPARSDAHPASPLEPTPLHVGRGVDLEPFFRGVGISARVPPQQMDAFLFRLGQVMRTMIIGITESLHLRAEQKNALRLSNTTIQPQDNNPLKLSAGVEETFANLLLRDSAAHLPPVEAVREAFDDLQQHQQLVLKAMRAALDAFVSRLDPEELEQKFARGRSNVLMNAANRLKYWDLYKDLYDVVAHHPPGELPLQFLDDFTQAYEQELERAGRETGAEPKAQVV